MKIAILADSLDNQNAGVHVYTKGVVEALLQFDSDNEYILIREKKDPQLPTSVKQIVVPNYRSILAFASLRLFVIIPWVLRRLQVDVVLEPAHFGPFNLHRRVKRITVIHDLTPLLFPEYHPWLGQFLQRIFLKRILKKTDLILSVSQNTKKDLIEKFPFTTAKVQVLYPGRDLFFQAVSDTKVLEKWQIDHPYFLSVGTVEPRKNLILLLKAYQEFREHHPEKILLLIVGGKGWKYEAFYTTLEKHPFRDDIHLLGYVSKSDLPALYTHALATIYPSIYEGFGLPVLEAMSCGSVVISSNSSSLPEVGGRAALYFDPQDHEALANQLFLLVNDEPLRQEKSNLSLQQANNFSWQNFAQAFKQLMEQRY